MGLFVRRKGSVIDFTKRHVSEKNNSADFKEVVFSEGVSESQGNSSNKDSGNSLFGGFSIFGGANPGETIPQSSSENYSDSLNDTDEKKKRFAKRIANMTDKIEEISNQLYHIQQRLEVLERKLNYSGDIQ